MTRYIAYKIFRALISLLIAVSLVFIFIRFSGDPAAALAPPDASQEVIEEYRELMGLDKPLHQQYTAFISGLFKGEYGYSIHTGKSSLTLFLERLPMTLRLGATALVIAVVFGVLLGTISALNRDSALDRLVMAFSVFAFAMPNFLFGLIIILVGALGFQVFFGGQAATKSFLGVIPPALTLGLASMGAYARFTRSSLLEIINSPFMRAAEARGVPRLTRLIVHAAPNAAIPLVTILGLSIGTLIAGSVVTEQVFAWPGVGQLLVRSVATRDIATVQFIVMAVAMTTILANLMIDLLYLVIDPRIRPS
ncbi:MAG: ABC transporter permease [Rhodobacteraceae bacterium]|nr:ABC transporter permease [Paracoccaceae bacterium]